MGAGEKYKVIVLPAANARYLDSILPHIDRNFSFDRVIEIDITIRLTVLSLEHHPNRGALELMIEKNVKQFRYILFRETRFFELKILYFVNEEHHTVYVTDFFPTVMHPKRLGKSEK
jgi:hypothetical protein